MELWNKQFPTKSGGLHNPASSLTIKLRTLVVEPVVGILHRI
jgi:hypothetical protein